MRIMIMIMKKIMRIRRKEKSKIDFAFANKKYFYNELDTSIPWLIVKYSIS
jgi:hypothetical protein